MKNLKVTHSERIQRQLRELNNEKKNVSIWDERRKDICYKKHKNNVWEIQKKADNSSPLIGIDDFFKYEYYKRNQMKAKHQAKANLALINRLNMILRSTGKVDHYNIFAENRSSKLENEIPNLKNIDRENRELAKFLKQIKPTTALKKDVLNKYWETLVRPLIFKSTKYPIQINALKTPEYDYCLIDPPSYEEFSKSLKIFFEFSCPNYGYIGKINVILFKTTPHVVDQFLQLCNPDRNSKTYQFCKIYRIVKSLFLEVGDVENNDGSGGRLENNFLTDCNFGLHNYPGTVSMLPDGNALTTKFSITFKRCPMLNGKQIVIGRVIKGLDVLLALQNHGTNVGLPHKNILIQRCGII